VDKAKEADKGDGGQRAPVVNRKSGFAPRAAVSADHCINAFNALLSISLRAKVNILANKGYS
jgi:hypothetical protein